MSLYLHMQFRALQTMWIILYNGHQLEIMCVHYGRLDVSAVRLLENTICLFVQSIRKQNNIRRHNIIMEYQSFGMH